jgi:1,2-dihydroxy-3-keto-5-methylthiopentene dioxygenase
VALAELAEAAGGCDVATVTVRDTAQTCTEQGEIEIFLKPYGITYERWNVGRLAADVPRPGETPQQRVLRVFAPEIEALQRRGGYVTADVVALSPQTPNLEAMLDKFRPEHQHTEDEVRFIVSGRGVFTIHGPGDRVFDIEVRSGDLLVVPAGTWHWFDLCEDRAIEAIRLFGSKEGWVPVYRYPKTPVSSP